MTNDEQAKRLSYIARALITDLRDVYAEECLGKQVNEERAMQLILDAFEQAVPVLTVVPNLTAPCPYCNPTQTGYVSEICAPHLHTCPHCGAEVDSQVQHMKLDQCPKATTHWG